MPPHRIRNQTRSDLAATVQAMMSLEWDLALIGKPPEVRRDAAIALLEAQRARLRLGTTQLAEIRDKLLANEQELKDGGEALREALEELEEVEKVVETTAALLSVVKTIVDIAV